MLFLVTFKMIKILVQNKITEKSLCFYYYLGILLKLIILICMCEIIFFVNLIYIDQSTDTKQLF